MHTKALGTHMLMFQMLRSGNGENLELSPRLN